jgi:hypothetical protein
MWNERSIHANIRYTIITTFSSITNIPVNYFLWTTKPIRIPNQTIWPPCERQRCTFRPRFAYLYMGHANDINIEFWANHHVCVQCIVVASSNLNSNVVWYKWLKIQRFWLPEAWVADVFTEEEHKKQTLMAHLWTLRI